PFTISLLVYSTLCCSYSDLLSFPTRRSSDLAWQIYFPDRCCRRYTPQRRREVQRAVAVPLPPALRGLVLCRCGNLEEAVRRPLLDRKSTRLNSSHEWISYAVFCLKKKMMNIF